MVTNTLPITELEQDEFCQDDPVLQTKPLIEEFAVKVRWQGNIPSHYLQLTAEELTTRIRSVKESLGSTVTILGHHYQRDEVIQFADVTGDSFKLSEYASKQEAEYIIFCGVHFMAETADILSTDNQKVILPNMTAGCSMADMANIDDVEDSWNEIMDVLDAGRWSESIIPITYMNSTAAIKALCGRNNGIVCTSSNADATFRWAFARAGKVLFLPDQHLGRNTAHKLGIKDEEMIVWQPYKKLGGHDIQTIQEAKVILWQGHCSVHTRFTVKQINETREQIKGINIMVHPECTAEVVQAADFNGSTESIIKTVRNAPSGTAWAIGTEINLVHRLAQEQTDKTVICLDSIVCPCATMYRIHPAYVLWVLDSILEKDPVNIINVAYKDKLESRQALDRMLSLV